MKTLKRGVLISVEGIDGSGKSTLLANVAQRLTSLQFPIIVTKEPGGTPLGKHLRSLLQERSVPVSSKAEYLLFAADRAQHFNDLIIPALRDNAIVISDRMADSSLVYQGYGRGLNMHMLETTNHWAMDGITPDITLYVRIPPSVAYDRFKQRKKLTTFEQEKEDFFNKLVAGFDTLFSKRTNVIHLDGQNSPELLTQQATDQLIEWISTHASN